MKRSVTMVGWLLAAAVLLAIVVDVGFAVWGGLATAFSWDRMQATASRLVFLEIVSLLSFLVIPIWLLSRLRRAENGLRTPALKGALVVSVAVAFIVMIATKLSFQDLPDDSLTPSLAVFVGLGFCLPQILLGATFGYVVTLAITLARRRPVLDASNAATLASWVVLSIGLVVPLASTLAPALYYYGASEAFRLGLALLPYVVGLAAISLLPFIIAAEWSSWLVRRYIQGERDLSKFGVLSGAVLALAGETAMLHWSAAMPGSGDLMGMSVLLPLTPLSMKVFAMLIGGVAGYTIVRIATIRMLRPAQAFRTVLAFGLALPLGMAIAAPQLPALLKCLFVLCRPLAGPLALMSNLTDFAIVYGLSLLPFALLAPAVKWLLVHSREAGSPRSALYGGSVSGSVAGVCLVAVLVHWDLWTNPASALDPVFQPLSFLAAHGFGVVAGGLAGALASVRPARVFG